MLIDRLDSVVRELDRRSESHPFLTRVWRRAIEGRIAGLRADVESARKALARMNDVPDLSPEQAIALVLCTHGTLSPLGLEHGLNG